MNNRLTRSSRLSCFQGHVKALLSASLISLILIGCSDDDAPSPTVNHPKPPQSDSNNNDSKADSGTNIDQLAYQFTRIPPPVPSPPGTQQINQELPGRAFQLNVFRKLDDTSRLEDVTDQVNWRSTDQSCQLDSCYTLSDGKIIGKKENKKIVLIAEFDGLETTEIELETLTSLKTCGEINNTDKAQYGETCLHIIEGVSGASANKLFTEPPRVEVINYLGYQPDRSYFNTGYTYANFTSTHMTPTEGYGVMLNSGYDARFQSDEAVGTEGQYARYCRDLADIEFNGRNNWRRSTKEELVELSNQDVVSTYGWPASSYSTSTVTSEYSRELASVMIQDGFVISINEGEAVLPTCVSDNP